MSYKTVPCEAKMIRLRACEGVFETTKHLLVDQVPLKVNFNTSEQAFWDRFWGVFSEILEIKFA